MPRPTEKLDCSKCRNETSHKVLKSVKHQHKTHVLENGDQPCYVSEGYVSDLMQCCGCETVVLRQRFWHDDFERGESENHYTHVYPPIVSRQLPNWYRQLPIPHQELLIEVYSALHAKSYSLTLMGLRALLDTYLAKKVGDQGSFASTLEILLSRQIVTRQQHSLIAQAFDSGSAASHRGYKPDKEVVDYVINVIELLLHQEILSAQTESVKSMVPKRAAKRSAP